MKHDMEKATHSHGLLLKVLLNRAHGSIPEPFLKAVPSALAKYQTYSSIGSIDPLPVINQHEKFFPLIHYSWIHQAIHELPLPYQNLILSTLSEKQKKGILKLLKREEKPLTQSPFALFIRDKILISALKFEEHLPIPFLPESPFNVLLKMTKNQLIDLIDLLAMYDLAHELKTIVATKHIKNLYSCLSAKQQQFLRECLHHKDRLVPSKLHLERWDGNCEPLLKQLHRRGLARLSVGLSSQHPDLVWYISRILDTGRGEILLKQYEEKQPENLTHFITSQVQSALSFTMSKLELDVIQSKESIKTKEAP